MKFYSNPNVNEKTRIDINNTRAKKTLEEMGFEFEKTKMEVYDCCPRCGPPFAEKTFWGCTNTKMSGNDWHKMLKNNRLLLSQQ